MIFSDGKSPKENLWEWSFGEGEGGEMAGVRLEVEEFMCKICPKVIVLRFLATLVALHLTPVSEWVIVSV